MSEFETKNALIESAKISTEDGFLTVWLTLDYGGTGQGFGGYILYAPKDWKHHNPSGPNYAGHFIARVMEVAGVVDWNRIVGKTIRVRGNHSGVHAIAHIVKEDWFIPKEDFDRMQPAADRSAA